MAYTKIPVPMTSDFIWGRGVEGVSPASTQRSSHQDTLFPLSSVGPDLKAATISTTLFLHQWLCFPLK